MKKSKIKFGQCYEKDDHMYMVMKGPYLGTKGSYWILQNTLSKNFISPWEKDLITWRRAFDNNG
jgi:hypothetical protein